MQSSKRLQAIETPIKDAIWRMHQVRLGYAPSVVTCNFIKGSNLVIILERPRSATEQFLLRQEKLQLARDVGIAINHILKNEIANILQEDFDLLSVDISLLDPASVERLSLWAIIEAPPAAVKESKQPDSDSVIKRS